MEYADGKVKDLQIAYIGGGSRGWAWTFMTDLAMDEELSGTIRLRINIIKADGYGQFLIHGQIRHKFPCPSS